MALRILAVSTAAFTLALLTFLPTPALAQDELAIEKYVAAVNDAAPQSDPISILVGDTITYGLAVSSAPSLAGTDVTVTDVFDGTSLGFEGATGGTCVDEGGDADTRIVCTVTLGDQGSSEVLLTFSALPLESGCHELVNRAELVADELEPVSAETTVEVCPVSEGTAAGTPGGTPGADAGGEESSGGTQPNTALGAEPGEPNGTLLQAGALLLFAATAWIVLGVCPRVAVEERR